MWRTQSSPHGRFAPSTLLPRMRIPAHRWDSIRHTERDKVSFPRSRHDRMSVEEFYRDLRDPEQTEPSLQTVDQVTDLQTAVLAHRQSIQEYIQIRTELLPLRPGDNDWIATRRQRSRSSHLDRALPRREIPISESCCHQERARFDRRA